MAHLLAALKRRLNRSSSALVFALGLTLAAIPLALTSCSAEGQASSRVLVDLESIDQFVKDFNEAEGKVRLVLLLSPT